MKTFQLIHKETPDGEGCHKPILTVLADKKPGHHDDIDFKNTFDLNGDKIEGQESKPCPHCGKLWELNPDWLKEAKW